ncbi:MAG: hypothetical protein ACM3L9_03755 [Deltaproteobacteria bacterium]
MGLILIAGSALSNVALPRAAFADTVDLDGAWSGGGSVKFPSGAKEAARCRANFKKRGAESYLVSARCASASGKVEQSALLTRVGGNQYTGSFFNEEYKVDGTITVTVSGNSQSVSISSPAGSSATFRLTR